jgi:pyrroline-5-carboxylate reductase
MKSALASFKGNKQYISIAAGLSTSSIQEMLGGARHIARAMPNLNASIQMAATGIYSHDSELGLLARAIFECVGAVEMVEKEELLHVVTGLSGSRPDIMKMKLTKRKNDIAVFRYLEGGKSFCEDF